MKSCTACKKQFPLSEFPAKQGRCRRCYAIARKENRGKLAKRGHDLPDGFTKPCSLCKRVLTAKEFYKDARSPSGLQSHCKRCWLERNKQHRKENIEVKRLKDRVYAANKR